MHSSSIIQVHRPLQQLPISFPLLYDRREPCARANDRPGGGARLGNGDGRPITAEDTPMQKDC